MSSEVIWKQKAQQRLHNITPWENWPSSCTELKGHSPSSSAASPTETWEIPMHQLLTARSKPLKPDV